MKIKNWILSLMITVIAVLYLPIYRLLAQYDNRHYTMNNLIVTQILYPIIFGAIWMYIALLKEQKAATCFLFAAVNAIIAVAVYKSPIYIFGPSVYTEVLTAAFLVWGIHLKRR